MRRTGHAAITFEWYRSFLQFLIDHNAQTWFAWLVTFALAWVVLESVRAVL